MKSKIGLFLFALPLLLTSCGGGSSTSSISTSQSGETSQIAVKIEDYLDIDLSKIRIEEGKNYTINFVRKQDAEILFEFKDSCGEILTNKDNIVIKANKTGESSILISLKEDKPILLGEKLVSVEKKVFYVPVPTGKVVLKGVGKECSVKVIILREMKESKINWAISDSSIIEYQTQDNIIFIKSKIKGISTITFSYGGFSESFDVYVTNLRGEI